MDEKTLTIRQGAIYWVNAEPHLRREEGGHHQKGNIRRPVVVVSNETYNQNGLAIVFPITSNQKKSRYLLPITLKKPSQILLTQILGYDMLAREAEYMGFDLTPRQLAYLKEILIHMV